MAPRNELVTRQAVFMTKTPRLRHPQNIYHFDRNITSYNNCEGHEDSPRQDKIICSMQTLPRSSTHAQSECPTVATELLKMGMVPLRDSLRELLYSPDAPRIAEAVIKTFDGI
ncbi:hypothetical protein TNCV_2378531 [Trichonephila clavipes]|nr:hypothetical protein TNCV_2378531 [Trichonephila clavipes]